MYFHIKMNNTSIGTFWNWFYKWHDKRLNMTGIAWLSGTPSAPSLCFFSSFVIQNHFMILFLWFYFCRTTKTVKLKPNRPLHFNLKISGRNKIFIKTYVWVYIPIYHCKTKLLWNFEIKSIKCENRSIFHSFHPVI